MAEGPCISHYRRRTAGALLGLMLATAFCVPISAFLSSSALAQSPASADIRDLLDVGYDERAEQAARAWLGRIEAQAGVDSLAAADARDLWIEARIATRRSVDDTHRLATEALARRESLQGPEDARLLASLDNLGRVLALRFEFDEAEAVLQRAVEIAQAEYGANSLELARPLGSLGVLHTETGAYSEALALLERCLSIEEAHLGPSHLQVGARLGNIVVLLMRIGEYERAGALSKRALDISRDAAGEESPVYASRLQEYANVNGRMGNWGVAGATTERVIEIRERVLGPDNPDLGNSLANQALNLMNLGDSETALRYTDRALGILAPALGPDHPRLARLQTNAAIALGQLDRIEEAIERLMVALALFESAYGPDHEQLAPTLDLLAQFHMQLGRVDEARPFNQRALAIRERAFGPDHEDVATSLETLGTLYLHLGEPESALPLFQRCYAIREQRFGPAHPWVAWAATSVANAYAALGDFRNSLAMAQRAEETSREHLRLISQGVVERQALSYADVRTGSLDLILSLAEAAPGDPVLVKGAWGALIRSRGLILDEIANRQAAGWASDDAEVGRLRNAVIAARRALAAEFVRGGSGAELQAARAAAEAAEVALAASNPSFRDERRRAQAGIGEIGGALPQDGALIAFVHFESSHRFLEDGRMTERGPEPAYLAFVMLQGGEPRAIPLGGAGPIDSAVLQWRQAMDREALAPTRPGRGAERAYRASARELTELVWDKLAPHLGAAAAAYIVTDGSLHSVSFASLPTDENSYLVETGPALHYLTAERDLVMAPDELQGLGLLAFGAPAFDAPRDSSNLAAREPAVPGEPLHLQRQLSLCPGSDAIRFEPLPAAAEEIRAVGALWADRYGADEAVALMQGAEANEFAFKHQATGKRVLHLATHGFFVDQSCGPAADGDGFDSLRQENPMLLSGLVFAGANRRHQVGPQGEDGILTAEEIASLDLRGVEWAVLSACDTGSGAIRSLEGVFGLRRAFQVAGARTTIMSLWPVEDQATRDWMHSLYSRRLVEGQATMLAVHGATLERLEARRAAGQNSHPFYWAGFVAAGDWR